MIKDRVTGAAAVAGGKPIVRRGIEIIAQPTSKSICYRGFTVRNFSKVGDGAYVDSYDSRNPFKSTNGQYDQTKRQSHGDIAQRR